MRNRAKCKLCFEIIESFLRGDTVTCLCGEIAIGGGDHRFHCWAKNWENFLRVADDDSTLDIKVLEEKDIEECVEEKVLHEKKPTRQSVLDTLNYFIENMEAQPQNAMSTALTQYDMLSIYILIRSILEID